MAEGSDVERYRKALDDIANVDIDRQSPNSADWRATLVYAVTVARNVIGWTCNSCGKHATDLVHCTEDGKDFYYCEDCYAP